MALPYTQLYYLKGVLFWVSHSAYISDQAYGYKKLGNLKSKLGNYLNVNTEGRLVAAVFLKCFCLLLKKKLIFLYILYCAAYGTGNYFPLLLQCLHL